MHFRLPTVLGAALAILVGSLAGCSAGHPLLLTATALTPSTIAVGAADTTIHVTGTGFSDRLTVLLNGTPAATTLVSAQELAATLPQSVRMNGGTYRIGVRDDEGAQGGSATLTTSLVLQVTNPQPSAAQLSPSTLLSGQAGADVTVTGTNLVPATTATVDGAVRSTRYLDASHLVIALTADDLLYPKQRSVVLTNPAPGGGSTAALVFTVENYQKTASQYHAYGDSITRGVAAGPSKGFAYLVAAANHLALTDPAQDGDQACDLFPRQSFKSLDGFSAAPGVVYSQMNGTNETFVKGVGSYEAVYKTCHLATLTWLALPRSSKVLAGDAGITATGGCVNLRDMSHLGTLYCGSGGGVALQSYTTYGSPLYLWYYVDDQASSSAAFSLLIDGATVGSYATRLSPAIKTQNGTTSSIAIARVPLSAGTHSVNITTESGGIGVLGFGTVPSSRAGLPSLIMGDIPVQRLTDPRAATAVQLQYSADARADFLAAVSDGLDMRFAPTREYMLGTAQEMSDSLHPNDLGHEHLAAAFQIGMQGLNGTDGLIAQSTGGLTAVPDGPLALVNPAVAGTTYQLPTSSTIITIGNVSAHGEPAQLVAAEGSTFDGGLTQMTLDAGETVTLIRSGARWRALRDRSAIPLTAHTP